MRPLVPHVSFVSGGEQQQQQQAGVGGGSPQGRNSSASYGTSCSPQASIRSFNSSNNSSSPQISHDENKNAAFFPSSSEGAVGLVSPLRKGSSNNSISAVSHPSQSQQQPFVLNDINSKQQVNNNNNNNNNSSRSGCNVSGSPTSPNNDSKRGSAGGGGGGGGVKTVANFLSLSAKKSRIMRENNDKKNVGGNDNNSLVSMNREGKEDDYGNNLVGGGGAPRTTSASSTRPTSESGRARGATPPRPACAGHMRSRSNDGLHTMMMAAVDQNGASVVGFGADQQPLPSASSSSTPQQQQQQRRPSSTNRRSASPNRIPRVPHKHQTSSTSLGGGGGGGPPPHEVGAGVGGTAASSQKSSPRRLSSSNAKTTSTADHHSCHSLAGSSIGGGSMSKRSWGGGAASSSSSNHHHHHHNNQSTVQQQQQQQQKSNGGNDPADHEQALFEQRLCEDAYGVAVRKINQNGKPNLRYVKCVYVECSSLSNNGGNSGGGGGNSGDLDTIGQDSTHSHSYYPSSVASKRSSVSSLARSFSRGGGKTGSSPSAAAATDQHQQSHHHNITSSTSRVRVLTWGKKKDVRLPLERFVCVRKGKTTERARRNASPSCRILSLITTDSNHQSLDIEAPTRLDRDKFARAFARFLDVPLVGEDKTAQSVSSFPQQRNSEYEQHHFPGYHHKKNGTTTTAMSEPDLASTPKQAIAEAKLIKQQKQQQYNNQSNSLMSNNINNTTAPLPVVMAGVVSSNGHHQSQGRNSVGSNSSNHNNSNRPAYLEGGRKPPQQQQHYQHHHHHQQQQHQLPLHRTSATTCFNNSISDPEMMNSAAHSSSLLPNPLIAASNTANKLQVQISSLPSSLKDSERSSTQAATASRPTQPDHHPHHHDDHSHHRIVGANNNNNNNSNVAGDNAPAGDASQVSSLTGAGFDQEIVEELHQALTELRAELEESRAEAARAVKVAEQAIQSAENSNSNDWNSTVTHKAAEAAALAQKKSAEAMAKQRQAEERLEGERRMAAFWRRQAEAAEEEAGTLQTRAAAAEVQRAAMAEELEAERRKTNAMKETLRQTSSGDNKGHTKLELRPSLSGDSSVMHSSKPARDLFDAQSEITLLKEKLALESAARRKLLHEVQDLRGVVRVYCRPKGSPSGVKDILSIPSQETLLLHPYDDEPPVSFKFDRVFSPNVEQREVYNEIEELCLSVLDGFNICLLAHGQRGTGKTYSMLGDVKYTQENPSSHHLDTEIKDQGIQLKTLQQLFSISEHRSERYQDTFTLEIVEVHNERLHDMLAGTEIGESRGQVMMEDARVNTHRTRRGMSEDGSAGGPPQQSNSHSVSSKQGSTMTKLEIRTNHNGDTVVQGLLSVEVKSFEDAYNIWQQCLSQRASRLAEQGADLMEYEASSHVIATLSVVSVNVATGMGSVGKIKFVDLAGADLIQRPCGDQKLCLTPDSHTEKSNNNNSNNNSSSSSSTSDWRYANRSLATLNDVINCRSQFMRSVPYRNSTLTHLLRDNLEADTKVLLLLCVSGQPKDLQETACALRFACGMRRVTIGKATKHSLSR